MSPGRAGGRSACRSGVAAAAAGVVTMMLRSVGAAGAGAVEPMSSSVWPSSRASRCPFTLGLAALLGAGEILDAPAGPPGWGSAASWWPLGGKGARRSVVICSSLEGVAGRC